MLAPTHVMDDDDVLRLIIEYCGEIAYTQAYFGHSFKVFKLNSIYRNAVSMCLLQIDELTGHFSEEFQAAYSGAPWVNIKGIRNIMAHKYGDVTVTTIWETITEDIPALHDYCHGILNKQLSE